MIELIKVHDARLIPKKLVEQVPRADAEKFYNYLKEAWKFKNDFLYAVIDEEHEIKGYVWYQVNMMDMSIFINTISICDEWKNTGKVKEITALIKKDMLQMGITKAFFLTDKPSFYEKIGMSKTEEVLLMGEFSHGSK
jgi:N-acetylglutamate synthase-like GNAT family acetyltransferase